MARDLGKPVEGFVLAGGRSTRFGGDKALAIYRGRSLLAWSLRALRSIGVAPCIVTSDARPYRRYAARFVTSEHPGLGPVEGLRAALDSCSAPWALVLSVDMPGVTSAALRALLANAAGQVVCYLDAAGRRHPFPGLYRRSLLAEIRRGGGGGPMHRLLDSADTRAIHRPGSSLRIPADHVLRNVNRPEDLSF